jgi:cytochrome oxidase Cu insertion factor (SCO1/SenC/PrrC family)
LALTDTKSNVWQAVGEENLYAFVDESAGFILTDNSGYILALVDKSGSSKTIVQGVTKLQKENLEKIFEKDNVQKFEGKVILPV